MGEARSPTYSRGVVAIDGKALRGTYAAGKKPIVHMVSAWAESNSLVLAQRKVDEKSNEITSIPKLLAALELSGTVVTIDAMGCQRSIARQIVEKKADYVLAVKENQGHLHEEIEDSFRMLPAGRGGRRSRIRALAPLSPTKSEDTMRNAAFTWKLLLTGLTIALAGLPLTLRGQTKGETDQQAVVAVIDWFVDAWNVSEPRPPPSAVCEQETRTYARAERHPEREEES